MHTFVGQYQIMEAVIRGKSAVICGGLRKLRPLPRGPDPLPAPHSAALCSLQVCISARINAVSGPFFGERGIRPPSPNFGTSRLQLADSVYN